MEAEILKVFEKVHHLGGAITINQDFEENRQFDEKFPIPSKQKVENLEEPGTYKLDTSDFNSRISLNHFIDGAQRSLAISKISIDPVGYFPVFFAIVVSSIVERENKSLSIWSPDGVPFFESENIGIFPDVTIDNINHRSGFWYYPCKEGNGKLAEVLHKVRRDLEAKCIKSWCAQFPTPNYILVDGGISHLRLPNVVGLVKNIQTTFITHTEFKDIVLNLKEGERSHLFGIPNRDNQIISCYLRLHTGPDLTGLVRLEMPLPVKEELKKTILGIAALIAAENTPSIYPTTRWDRQIYPIQACEEFLRSHMPSLPILKAQFQALTL